MANGATNGFLLSSTQNIFNLVKRSSLYSNAYYLMLNSVVTSLLGFVFWNIMARFFSAAEVGIGSALVAASGLVGTLASLGLGFGLIRFVPEAGEGAGQLVNAALTLAGAAAVAGSLVYLAGAGEWSPDLVFVRENVWLLALFVLFTVAATGSALTDCSLVARRTARYVFWKNTVTCLLKLPLPVFIFAHLRGYGIFAGTGAATLVGLLLSWFWFLPSVYRGYSPYPVWPGDMVKKILPYSFGNYLAGMLNSLPGLVYPIMALTVLGPEESAFFYIAWMMTMVLAIIPGGLSQSLMAEGSYDQGGLGQNARRSLAVSLSFSVPAVGLMALLAGWLLHFFGSGYAENGTAIVRFLALSIIPQCINTLYMTVNQVRKNVPQVIAQTGSIAVISLGLGWLMLRLVGLPGIGMAYTIAHLVVALVVVWPLWRALREKP
ncbi:MAG: lipopolysaccharide biosynthesis protein [Firmicutes bacterium]|nr:lipopolysaccharide biosynthesis protein [Bacillota bacterium]